MNEELPENYTAKLLKYSPMPHSSALAASLSPAVVPLPSSTRTRLWRISPAAESNEKSTNEHHEIPSELDSLELPSL